MADDSLDPFRGVPEKGSVGFRGFHAAERRFTPGYKPLTPLG